MQEALLLDRVLGRTRTQCCLSERVINSHRLKYLISGNGLVQGNEGTLVGWRTASPGNLPIFFHIKLTADGKWIRGFPAQGPKQSGCGGLNPGDCCRQKSALSPGSSVPPCQLSNAGLNQKCGKWPPQKRTSVAVGKKTREGEELHN